MGKKRLVQHIAKDICDKEQYMENLLYVEEIASFFLYDEYRHYYQHMGERDVKRLVISETFDEDYNQTESFVKNIIFLMKAFTMNTKDKLPKGHIALTDGLLNLKTFQLEPFDKSVIAYHKVGCAYEDTKKEPTRFLQFLNEVLVDKDGSADPQLIAVCQEMFGYYLLEDIRKPYVFFLYGSGSNGKSIMLDVLEQLIGKEYTSSLTLENLTGKHGAYELVGKRINIVREEESKYMRIDKLKTIISGEPIRVEPKYQQGFTFVPTTKFIYGTNKLMQFADIDYGLKRRLKIMPFYRKFEQHEQDINLRKRLFEEIPGILGWAIEGAKRLIAQDWVFSNSTAMDEMVMALQIETSSPIEYIQEKWEESAGDDFVSNDDLYTFYKYWCEEVGRKQKGKKNFLHDIGKVLKKPTKVKRTPEGTKRGRMLKSRDIPLDKLQ